MLAREKNAGTGVSALPDAFSRPSIDPSQELCRSLSGLSDIICALAAGLPDDKQFRMRLDILL